MFIFGQISFGQKRETAIFWGAGNYNYKQLFLGEGVTSVYFDNYNPNYFFGVSLLNETYFVNLQISYFDILYNYSKHSANTSSSPYSAIVYLQTIETKVTLGVHPVELGNRFTFTPQFSLGISHLVKGSTLIKTYNPSIASPGNGGYVFSNEKNEGGLLSTMAGLKTEFQLWKNISLFMTNDFGLMLGYQVGPVSFYNSIGISYKFEEK